MNFSMVASGSRPTWSAYDRTKDRLKMPPGRREISLRSSASSAATVIFVVLEICLSDTPRCSRAALSMLPKSPESRSAAVVTACRYVRKQIPECQTRARGIHNCTKRSRAAPIAIGRVGHEQTDRGCARCAGASGVRQPLERHSADRQNGYLDGGRNPRQAVDPKEARARARRLRRRRPDRTGDEVIDAGGSGHGLVHGMHGDAHDERRRRGSADGSCRNGIAPEMNPGGAASDRHIEPIVHEDARRAAARQADQFVNEVSQRACLEITLADLQIVDTRVDGMSRLRDQTSPHGARVGSAAQSTAIGDELEDQGSTCESVEKIGASSDTPTRRLMNPSPLMPPRTNELLTKGRSIGQVWAK